MFSMAHIHDAAARPLPSILASSQAPASSKTVHWWNDLTSRRTADHDHRSGLPTGGFFTASDSYDPLAGFEDLFTAMVPSDSEESVPLITITFAEGSNRTLKRARKITRKAGEVIQKRRTAKGKENVMKSLLKSRRL